MSSSTADLRAMFLDPPNVYRHLAIIHPFVHRHDKDKKHASWHSIEPESMTDTDLRERLVRRLQRIKDWGFGGVVANVGPSSYLEDEEEWRVFLAGFDAARQLGMNVWIYDEDGYPSGAAGGLVLREHPEYEAQSLVRMRQAFEPGEKALRPPSGWWYAVWAEARLEGNSVPVNITDQVGDDGFLWFTCDRPCVITRYDVRHAFEGTHCTCNVFRARRYINVLSREAVRCFYETTEGRYFERMGKRVDEVEAVFTDEPSFMSAYHMPLPPEWKERVRVQDPYEEEFDRLPMVAWDRSLPRRFEERYGLTLPDRLGSLFEGRSARDVRLRHDFYELQSEMYADAFFGLQQNLLAEKNIAFSGHVLCEESLTLHVACQANLMANLQRMRIPGIDMLCSVPESIYNSTRLLACKYGSSAAHARGREQVMCEASEFEERAAGTPVTLAQRRGAFALQMALGITTMTSYYPWHECDEHERRSTLDFWSRLAVILRSGTHAADLAVLYPVRTGWAHYRPTDRTLTPEDMDEPLRSMDNHLLTIAHSILRQGMDFDFVEPSDLADARVDGGRLRIADEEYPALVLPPSAVMSEADLQAVERFVGSGGRLIALEPLSSLALDEGGRSAESVIGELASRTPDRVLRALVGSDWLYIARTWMPPGARVRLDGPCMAARRSVCDETDFVLVVNASSEAAGASVEFGDGRSMELWDPWEARVTQVGGGTAELMVGGYSAIVGVSRRSGQ